MNDKTRLKLRVLPVLSSILSFKKVGTIDCGNRWVEIVSNDTVRVLEKVFDIVLYEFKLISRRVVDIKIHQQDLFEEDFIKDEIVDILLMANVKLKSRLDDLEDYNKVMTAGEMKNPFLLKTNLIEIFKINKKSVITKHLSVGDLVIIILESHSSSNKSAKFSIYKKVDDGFELVKNGLNGSSVKSFESSIEYLVRGLD